MKELKFATVVRFIIICNIVCIVGRPITASAAVIILQDDVLLISVFNPSIGQSFTAEDTELASIAFSFRDFNPGSGDTTLEMRLYEDEGFGGALLDSKFFSLTPGFDGFFDVDFSGNHLVVGSKYTAQVLDNNARWGIYVNQHAFPPSGGPIPGRIDYVGGHKIDSDGSINLIKDLRFRISTPSTVPEPITATLGLMGLGVLGIATRRRAAG